MGKNRLEAFSDGVLAIIITIMVLELKAPHEVDFHALEPVVPVFLSYVLSFQAGERRHSVGESAPAVLAVSISLLNSMDG